MGMSATFPALSGVRCLKPLGAYGCDGEHRVTLIQINNVCFGVGSRRRSAPQVSDLIDTKGTTRARLFTQDMLVVQSTQDWQGGAP